MTNGNEIAYPSDYLMKGSGTVETMFTFKGLTKREYFAALAMQGLLASGNVNLISNEIETIAVAKADALINALNKTNE